MKSSNKSKRRKELMSCIVFVIIIVLFVVLWKSFAQEIDYYADFISITIDLVAIIIAVFGALMIVVQLHDTKNIQQAEFIVNLNQSFVENSDYARAYTELESCDISNRKPNLSRIDISNYMTFFETMSILLRKKVINIEVLDDLFAYRFFIAVHNETIQEIKLVAAPQNFRNIYYLEKLWMNYRKDRGLEIYKEENSLEKVMEENNKSDVYNKIIGEFEKKRR